MNHEGHEGARILKFDRLSGQIIGCAIEVHKNLGPGLLESAGSIINLHEIIRSWNRLVNEF